MKLNKVILGGATLFMMFSCGGSSSSDSQGAQEAPEYPTAVMKKQSANLEMVYPIVIKGKDDVEIRPRIDGNIEAIYVDEGSIVRKGQRLFKINSPVAIQNLTTAEANVNSVNAQVKTAKLNVDRTRPLAEKGIVSEVQLQTVENAYQTALASLKQAEASLMNARATMGWTEVTSPVDGVVGTIPYRLGSLVNSTNVLTNVANISDVYANFSLNEKDIITFLDKLDGNTQAEKIKNAPPITLVMANGEVYPEKGKLETISGVINPGTGTANFRAEFPNKQGTLRSGASGKITIPKTLESVIVIPQEATFALQDKVLVYKVQGDSVIQTVVNAISMPNGKDFAITGGLSEGDKIVTGGVATLRSGTKIKVQ